MLDVFDRWLGDVRRLFGVVEISPEDYRFFVATDYVYALGGGLHVIFIFIFVVLGIGELVAYNILSALIFLTCVILNRRARHGLTLLLVSAEVIVHAVFAVYMLGWWSGYHYYVLALFLLLFFYPGLNVVWKSAGGAILVLAYGLLYAVASHAPPQVYLPSTVLNTLHFSNIAGLGFILSYFAFYYSRAAHDTEQALRLAQEKLEESALTDPLTALLNRRAMNDRMEWEKSRINRGTKTFVLVLGDIDNFKVMNDSYGHTVGDMILVAIAGTMKATLRKHDAISRWGGEEFLLLFPESESQSVVQAVEQLRERIAALEFPDIAAEHLPVTMTFGVCQYRDSMAVTECIRCADQAMYEGKRKGKNCVVLAHD